MRISRSTVFGVSAIAVWGATIPWLRILSDSTGPVSGGAWMTVIAAATLWTVRLARGQWHLPRTPWRSVALSGSMFAAYMVLFTFAVGNAASASESVAVGLVNYLWPSLGVAFAPFFERRPFTLVLGAGVLLALFGTAVALFARPDLSPLDAAQLAASRPLPYVAAGIGAMCWAIYSNVAGWYRSPDDENGAVWYSTFAAIGVSIVALSMEGFPAPPTPGLWASALLLGSLTGWSFLAWDEGVRTGQRRFLETAALFTPILSVVAAAAAQQAFPEAGVAGGACLLVLAAFVCNSRFARGSVPLTAPA
jgi:drug/metabolite transporter (DMT)-like permease